MRPSIVERPVLGILIVTLLACGSAGAGPEEPAPDQPAPNPAPGEPAPSGDPGEVAFETIAQQSVPSKVGGQVREAVRDQAAWQRVWTDLAGGSGLSDEPPAVDFERDMVIAAAMPTQGCVSRVTIRVIAEEAAGGLVVDLLEQPPAPGVACVVSERPFHAVRLARRDGEVRWEVETRPLDPGTGQGEAPEPGR